MKKFLLFLMIIPILGFSTPIKNIEIDGNLFIYKQNKTQYSGEKYTVYNLCKFKHFKMEKGKFKNKFSIYFYEDLKEKEYKSLHVELPSNQEGVFEETLKKLSLTFNGCIY